MGPLLPSSPMSSFAALHVPPQGTCVLLGRGQGSCTCPIPLLRRILRWSNDLSISRPSQVGPNRGPHCPDPPVVIAPRWAFPHPSVWFTQTETHPPGAQDFDGDLVCLATRSPTGTRRKHMEPDSMGVGGAGRASVAAGLRVGWRLAGQRGSMDSAGDRVGGDRGLWED